jgi:hypothetical protein
MQQKIKLWIFLSALLIVTSCSSKQSAQHILQTSIASCDTLRSISYQQLMARTNPQTALDTIFRYREMYFERLQADSLVGVKGHWYMYVDDKETVVYEDIYDGNTLLRINHRDSLLRLYKLLKYPVFKEQHFWGHQTPFSLQYEMRFMLKHAEAYTCRRMNDTLIDGTACFQVQVFLHDYTSMPGFAAKLEPAEGHISEFLFVIDQQNYLPVRMKTVTYSTEQPDQKVFLDQHYRGLRYNFAADSGSFNTTTDRFKGYSITEMIPE